MDDPIPENSGHSATIIFILLVVTTVSICNSVMIGTTFVKMYVPFKQRPPTTIAVASGAEVPIVFDIPNVRLPPSVVKTGIATLVTCFSLDELSGLRELIPVSCYAFFKKRDCSRLKRMAASKPTSWMSILGDPLSCNLTQYVIKDLSWRSGLFPSRMTTFAPSFSLPYYHLDGIRS
jgi:hypothetical protein